MGVVGPGAVTEDIVNPSPALEGASEYEYVTILNPLTDDFKIKVAQDVAVDLPFEIRQDGQSATMTKTESDARQIYGLNLKNRDHTAKRRVIINDAIIPAGKTINLKGNEAQVAVRQLVNEIMQREGNRMLISNPEKRKEIEDKIIVRRGSVQDLMDNRLQSVKTQTDEAITRSNEVNNEESFAGLTQTGEGSEGEDSSPAGVPEVARKSVGRPKKADS